MKEIFKDIPGYEGIYQVSNMGRVRKIRYLESHAADGYHRVRLCRGAKDHKMKLVHRLVAEAFLENPDNLPEINHKDEDKSNNRVDNLEYCTHEYNINYGSHNKKVLETLTRKGILNKPIYQYSINGELIKKHNSVKECELLGFKKNSIYGCCRKEKGGLYNNYIWSYKELGSINIEDYIVKTKPKKINQYDKNMNLIKVWESATSTKKEGFNPSAIIQCCKNSIGYKKHKGFIWKYAE